MSLEVVARAGRIKPLLRADGVCFWRAGADGVALPASCDPPGLLAGAFGLPDLGGGSVEFAEGTRGARLLPLAVRAGLDARSPTFAALHALGGDGCGFFAFWNDSGRVPVNYHEVAEFAAREWAEDVGREVALERLGRVSAHLHGLASALPQGVLVLPRDGEEGLVNAAAAQWLGLAPGAASGPVLADALRRLFGRTDDRGEAREFLEDLLLDTGGPVRQGLLRLAGGAQVLRFTVTPIESAVHGGWVWLLEDVTGREGAGEPAR